MSAPNIQHNSAQPDYIFSICIVSIKYILYNTKLDRIVNGLYMPISIFAPLNYPTSVIGSKFQMHFR